tara:strand:+ start:672 stop:878 length:207 start_codon:yes stop_codon:yes gene_type:complete
MTGREYLLAWWMQTVQRMQHGVLYTMAQGMQLELCNPRMTLVVMTWQDMTWLRCDHQGIHPGNHHSGE